MQLLSAESKYQFGTVCLKKGKIINFERNIVFDSVNVRNKKNFIAYNYAGIIIVKKNKLFKNSKIFKKSENFEKEFYPLIIKRNKTNLKKIKGFFHSIDNMKDINATSKKVSKYNYKNIVSLKKYLNEKLKPTRLFKPSVGKEEQPFKEILKGPWLDMVLRLKSLRLNLVNSLVSNILLVLIRALLLYILLFVNKFKKKKKKF